MPSNFLKAVFWKFYLVRSWILCLKCSNTTTGKVILIQISLKSSDRYGQWDYSICWVFFWWKIWRCSFQIEQILEQESVIPTRTGCFLPKLVKMQQDYKQRFWLSSVSNFSLVSNFRRICRLWILQNQIYIVAKQWISSNERNWANALTCKERYYV